MTTLNSNAFQFGGAPEGYGSDKGVFNYQSADIPEKRGVILDATNTLASGKEGIGVKLPANGGSRLGSFGVTIETLKANGAMEGKVRTSGTAVMVADGAITCGDYVEIDNDVAGNHGGFAKSAALASGKLVIGMALDTVGDAEEVIVLLFGGQRTA